MLCQVYSFDYKNSHCYGFQQEFRARRKRLKTNDGWEASTVQAMQNEMDNANHDDETKWLLPAYMADQPHLRK
jgi:hypothetical protein